MAKHKHICERCGKEFESYFESARFCCRDCYNSYSHANSKYKDAICPICGSLFRPTRKNSTFCSVSCRVESTRKQIQCSCDYCGKTFMRAENEVCKHKRHYCSHECARLDMWWSDEDSQILVEYYGKKSYDELSALFSKPRTRREISRRAIYLNLTKPQAWTREEIEILRENYSEVPMDTLLALLPGRSKHAIVGQARTQKLYSYYFLNRKYTEADDAFLRNNYLSMSDAELAKVLCRSSNGVAQHLTVLGLKRSQTNGKYQDLNRYIRARLMPWRREYMGSKWFTCEITGVERNVVIHHIRGFSLILSEAMDNLKFPTYASFEEYTQEQLDTLFEEYMRLQTQYDEFICISEELHKRFHGMFGYGNNTRQQWDEFVSIISQ